VWPSVAGLDCATGETPGERYWSLQSYKAERAVGLETGQLHHLVNKYMSWCSEMKMR